MKKIQKFKKMRIKNFKAFQQVLTKKKIIKNQKFNKNNKRNKKACLNNNKLA